jgi:hypothetical protein
MIPPLAKPTRLLPRTLKPATIDSMDAINRGLLRKHPRLSHAGSKACSKRQQFATPSDKDIFLAKRYRRTLSHLQ